MLYLVTSRRGVAVPGDDEVIAEHSYAEGHEARVLDVVETEHPEFYEGWPDVFDVSIALDGRYEDDTEGAVIVSGHGRRWESADSPNA